MLLDEAEPLGLLLWHAIELLWLGVLGLLELAHLHGGFGLSGFHLAHLVHWLLLIVHLLLVLGRWSEAAHLHGLIASHRLHIDDRSALLCLLLAWLLDLLVVRVAVVLIVNHFLL